MKMKDGWDTVRGASPRAVSGEARKRKSGEGMSGNPMKIGTALLALSATLLIGAAQADTEVTEPVQTSSSTAPASMATRSPIMVPRSQRGELFIARRWGVDQLRVRYTSSGSSLEFRYRVVDPDKASVLSDKKATPVLIDQKSQNKFGVPQMENIGTLREATQPEAGREYWMVFQNQGKTVKPGNRVDIAIGSFRVAGLVVE
jgi:hypothetical protein